MIELFAGACLNMLEQSADLWYFFPGKQYAHLLQFMQLQHNVATTVDASLGQLLIELAASLARFRIDSIRLEA